MTIRLNGQTSGYVELEAPATAGSNTLVLPTNNGTSGQYLQTNGSGALSWQTVTDTTTNLTRLTAVDTSSGAGTSGGTAVVYDNLPSGVRRITVLVYDVSSNGTPDHIRFLLRTGSGTDVTSGYSGFTSYLSASNANHINSKTNSFPLWNAQPGENTTAEVTFSNVDGNRWIYNATGSFTTNFNVIAGGYIDLGAQLTGIKMYMGNGNDFDSGRVNLFYEV